MCFFPNTNWILTDCNEDFYHKTRGLTTWNGDIWSAKMECLQKDAGQSWFVEIGTSHQEMGHVLYVLVSPLESEGFCSRTSTSTPWAWQWSARSTCHGSARRTDPDDPVTSSDYQGFFGNVRNHLCNPNFSLIFWLRVLPWSPKESFFWASTWVDLPVMMTFKSKNRCKASLGVGNLICSHAVVTLIYLLPQSWNWHDHWATTIDPPCNPGYFVLNCALWWSALWWSMGTTKLLRIHVMDWWDQPGRA